VTACSRAPRRSRGRWGGYETPEAFTDGLVAALPFAVVVLAAGAVLALLTPGRPRAEAAPATEPRRPIARVPGAAQPAHGRAD
jgi:hypothetical protein